MSRQAIAITLLLLLAPAISLIGSAATPRDIVADGSLSDWDADSLMATDNNSVSFRLT